MVCPGISIWIEWILGILPCLPQFLQSNTIYFVIEKPKTVPPSGTVFLFVRIALAGRSALWNVNFHKRPHFFRQLLQ